MSSISIGCGHKMKKIIVNTVLAISIASTFSLLMAGCGEKKDDSTPSKSSGYYSGDMAKKKAAQPTQGKE